MNVRITPRGAPQRTDLYAGITRVYSDGAHLWLVAEYQGHALSCALLLSTVAEIALDEDPGTL